MENVWKELLSYVKKKTVVKRLGICREGHLLKMFKMYSTTCSEFYGNRFIAEVCASGIEYFSRPVRQDLYEHIPDIHIYGTDTFYAMNYHYCQNI
mgnify:CR=1 FL=1